MGILYVFYNEDSEPIQFSIVERKNFLEVLKTETPTWQDIDEFGFDLAKKYSAAYFEHKEFNTKEECDALIKKLT